MGEKSPTFYLFTIKINTLFNMKSIKVIFIVMETVMLLTVILTVIFCDWTKRIAEETAWMYQSLIILASIGAVICQKEQQAIDWNE